ncbi:MAG: chromosome segregation protein SMC [Eubacteriales bacterium]|nr:chromosome segregation protein SMC [Eubacteriales bacterium]
MFLKAVEIQGFKSFPGRQYIEFQPGLTCIVGPNGSGKSNVTDAVRWVLGEQSAKSLRGNKMEDVIFNGTSTRKRLAMAEVSLHLDNSDHYYDLDYDTIVVTRRYYRSGESEYLINQRSCRLKDITELFADTGLGKDGYSIIEQGRVDAILSDRSDDRRKVFDEAAGIVKYKMRKQEADRKLARTNEDLERLDDISQEMERNLKPLARQAKQALAYRELAAELRDLDIHLTIQDLAEAEDKAQKQADFLADLTAEFTQLTSERDLLYQKRRQLLADRKSFDEQSTSLQVQFQEKSRALFALSEEAALAGEGQRQARQRLQDIGLEETNLATASEGLEAKLSQRTDRQAELEKRQETFRRQLEQAEAKARELEDKLSAQDRAEAARKAEILQRREDIFQARSQVFALDRELSLAQERRDDLTRELAEVQQKLGGQEEQAAELQLELQSMEEAIRQQEEITLRLQAEKANFQKKFDLLKAQLSELEQSIKQKDYQLQTLKRLEENREGYHQAVKSLGREADRDPHFGEGLLGPVAELIRVEASYETAVEMSLGPALHNLVTRDSQVATRLITWLKREKAGRETFLPLDKIEARSLSRREEEELAQAPGYLGTLDQHINCPAEFYPLASYLGGRILLAEDLPAAIDLADRTHKRFKIVSLEGDLIHPGGSMTGGQSKRGLSGLISRSREIEEISQEISQLEVELSANQGKLAGRVGEEDSLAARQEEASQHLQSLREERAKKQEQVKYTSELAAQLAASYQRLETEKLAQEDLVARSNKQKAECQAKLKVQEAELQELEQLPEQLDQGNQRDRQTLLDLREEITDYKVSLGSVSEALKAILELQDQLKLEQAQRQASLLALAREKQELQQKLEDLAARETHRLAEEAELKQVLQDLEQAQAALRSSHEASSQAEQDIFAQLEGLNGRLSSLEGEKAKAQGQADRLSEKLNVEKNRIWEEYRFSYNQAKELAASLDLENPTKRRLKQLKDELREMPPVNHSAPQDYEDLQERYNLMQEQAADIRKARQQLLAVIEELETAMREQFMTQLEAIKREFQACFVDLFSGGSATLELSEGDILEADIEIRAQPPGKRLQRLSLLSGGERALTAIALVFAIFRQRPAPFCVLDEVDSALDEANVIRFAEFVEAYAHKTQFIVVTHRRGTMEAAERLYGVTMKERGVSSILSLALAEGQHYTN